MLCFTLRVLRQTLVVSLYHVCGNLDIRFDWRTCFHKGIRVIWIQEYRLGGVSESESCSAIWIFGSTWWLQGFLYAMILKIFLMRRRKPTATDVDEIARRHNLTEGKWCLFPHRWAHRSSHLDSYMCEWIRLACAIKYSYETCQVTRLFSALMNVDVLQIWIRRHQADNILITRCHSGCKAMGMNTWWITEDD